MFSEFVTSSVLTDSEVEGLKYTHTYTYTYAYTYIGISYLDYLLCSSGEGLVFGGGRVGEDEPSYSC